MNQALHDRIRPVAHRLRSQQFWRIVALVAILATIFTLVVSQFGHQGDRRVVYSVLTGTVVALVCGWILCQFSFRDPRAVARRIEQRFPNLEQRLLTAVNLEDSANGYLQQQVIREARNHSHGHPWTSTVSAGKLITSRLVGLGSLVLLGIAAGTVISDTEGTDAAVAGGSGAEFRVTVEPGDTEIERGSSLVVTAQFNENAVPETAQLICTQSDDEGKTVTMTRSLSDPVVAGFLSSVTQDFQYRVVSPNWESQTYQVKVFDFPALVRSDANLDFPSYTGLDEKLVEDTVRVSAIEGTKVTWHCFLNKEVAVAELVEKDGTRLPLNRIDDDSDAVSVTIDLLETKRLTLKLTDHAGRQNKFPPELIARVLPNLPPELKLTSFGDTSVSPLEELPLEAEVQDDVGVAKVGLSYSLDGQDAKEITLKSYLPRGAKSSLSHLVELESLSAEPDQLFFLPFLGRRRRTGWQTPEDAKRYVLC